MWDFVVGVPRWSLIHRPRGPGNRSVGPLWRRALDPFCACGAPCPLRGEMRPDPAQTRREAFARLRVNAASDWLGNIALPGPGYGECALKGLFPPS